MRGQLHQFAFSSSLLRDEVSLLGWLELVVGCVVVGSGSLVEGGGSDGELDVVLGAEVGLGRSGGGAGASLLVGVSEVAVLLVVVSTSEVVTALLVGGGGGGSIDGVVEEGCVREL